MNSKENGGNGTQIRNFLVLTLGLALSLNAFSAFYQGSKKDRTRLQTLVFRLNAPERRLCLGVSSIEVEAELKNVGSTNTGEKSTSTLVLPMLSGEVRDHLHG